MESIFIETTIDSKKTVVGVIYRPPGGDLNEFNETLTGILDKLKSEKNQCYLLGDFNINLLSYDAHSLTAEFIDMMYLYTRIISIYISGDFQKTLIKEKVCLTETMLLWHN